MLHRNGSWELTIKKLKHLQVKVIRCPRSAGKGHSWSKKQETETIYTHHQKTVIVDADAGNYRRRIMAFVGGLDLYIGRYDTPLHSLFSTLQTLHKDDYHQPNYTGSTTSLPREPWHDLHSQIGGPAPYDVLKNFKERWLRASKLHGIQKIKKTVDDSLLKLERISDKLGIDEAHCTSEQDPESWHVQVFRSIDSNSVKGFPKDPKEATSKNLVCGKNVLIDMSIHTATNGTTLICVQARRKGQLPLSKQWVSQQAAAAVAAISIAKIQATLISVLTYGKYEVCIGLLACRGLSLVSTPLHAMKSQSQIQSSAVVKFRGVTFSHVINCILPFELMRGREHSQEINNLSVPVLISQAPRPSRKRSRSPSSPFFQDAITFSDGKPASETSKLNPEDVTARLEDLEVEIDTLHADIEDKELLISELQDSLAAAENEIAMLQIRVADAEDRRAEDHDQIQKILARLGL
ncbi:phospholipase D beta 1-like protein [Tanacetum coccineum]